MDLNNALLGTLAGQPCIAVGILFVCGICNAFGPCNAQRVLGFIACTEQRKSLSTSFFYAAGIVIASTLLLLSATFLQQCMSAFHLFNSVMACMCLAIGLLALWRAEAKNCRHATPALTAMTPLSIMMLGFGSSAIVAPCCTPFLFLIAAYAPARLLPVDAIAYACGSAFPYLIGGIVLHRSFFRFVHSGTQQAFSIITASLTIALGLIYCVEI